MKTRTHLRVIALSLLLILCISLPQNVWGSTARERNVNIYASLLTCSLNGKAATFSFAANADQGKGVWVYVDLDEDGVCETEEEVYSNANTIVDRDPIISVESSRSLPGGRYRWAVKVKGDNTQTLKFNTSGSYFESKNNTDHTIDSKHRRPACATLFDYEDNRYDFQYPKGLAVNAFHDSPYLGFSYVGEAGWLRDLSGNADRRTGSSRGIYLFRPNLGHIWSSQTYKAFTGNLTGGNKDNGAWCDPDDTRNKYFGPNRVTTDKDGYVYIAENRPTGDRTERIWRVHHSNLKSGTNPNFSCILSTNNLTGLNISNIKGRVFSISIGYEGDEKLLYIISGNTSNAVVEYAHLTCWKITENANGTCTLTYTDRYMSLTNIKQGSTTHILKSPQCSVVPGRENGDLWIFQRTDAYEDKNGNKITASGQFSALHLSKSGNNWVADYHIPSRANDPDDEYHQNSSGTGAISTHHVLGNTNEYYLAMPCRAGENSANSNGYVVKIFRMYKDANNKLHRARWWNLYRDYNASPYAGWGRPDDTAPGEGIDGVAFDAANNLYFTASGRHLFVYALPKENEHITFSPTELHVPYGTTTWVHNKEGHTVVSGTMKALMLDTDPMPVLSKDGWIFEGWYNNAACTGDPIPSVYADDLTLYAKWTEIKINEGTEANNTGILTLVDDKTVGMKVNRKMPGGSFSTLCLPFAINNDILNSVTWDEGSDLTGNPLEGATLWTFSGVTTDEDANTKTLVFTQTTEVSANTPFLILPQNDVAEDIFFHHVTIEKAPDLTNAGEVTHDGITFHGFINPVLLKASPNNFFLVANNRLATSYYDSMLPALRGYFTAQEGAKLQIRTQQETPTLLENVNSNIKNTYKIQKDGNIYIIRDQIIYDLQGNRVVKF